MAAAGGGIQAAAWTARVLTGLEEMCAEKRPGIFARSLKLLSGVSGGSVGIMYFVTAYQLEGFLAKRSPDNGRWTSLLQAVADVAKRSGLSEAIRGVAYTDFIRTVAPFCLADIYRNRGEGLERAWVRGCLKSHDLVNRLSMRRIAIRSIRVSEVCTRCS